MNVNGRAQVFTRFTKITPENITFVTAETSAIHLRNQAEIEYLYDYYRGLQDILHRVKTVRPTICNKVVVNRANEIVSFKSSYFLSNPIQFIGRGDVDVESINKLNDALYSEDIDSKDKEIVDWMHICGVAYRMVLPDQIGDEDGSPANVITLNPEYAYAIYSREAGYPMIGAVLVREDEFGSQIHEVYTKEYHFVVNGGKVEVQKNLLGLIPIVEYVSNEARIGAFEVVLPILNALNVLEANRTDSVEDYVSAYDVFQNCEIDESTYRTLTSGGQAINIKDTVPGASAKVYRVASELNQNGVQTAIDDLYDAVLSICGMPMRNDGGSSPSDSGQAVLYRNGWSDAEARAKDTEALFRRSERQFLRVFLKICEDSHRPIGLSVNQIAIKCPRRNSANMLAKVQTFDLLAKNDLVAPIDAWTISDISTDPSESCARGVAYRNEQNEILIRSLTKEDVNGESSLRTVRPSDSDTYETRDTTIR